MKSQNVAENQIRYLTTAEAAEVLGMTQPALRAAARRHARREPRGVVARLGAGIMAVRFGRRGWRFVLTVVQ